ncbi:O-antigen polysaccharide polymerase Wzy [Psychrobacillus sp. OK028]|uniref:O-antigen polysaccharide polymerase Wzy n=1 Tax=Psychrobacillus sp. OK028 TaxID=1884359 RepID=UPI0008910C74|nr:O-antigen polysaccharide polymerase Wzy [Psychrobacillus sp. OK028]SDO00477.1 O-antigen polysaccharide polymerase Wzy [Psychrobacillus sp. OK028]
MENKITKNFLKRYFVLCSITLFVITYLISIFKNLINFDPIILTTFIIIGGLSFYNSITSLKYEFSLYKIHGYFFLIFLFLAPLHQYVTRSFPWQWNINERVIILGNLLIIVWLIIYLTTYFLMPAAKKTGHFLPQGNKYIILGFFLTVLSSVITVFSVGGIPNLFSRAGADAPVLQSISLILSTSVRPFPALFFSYLFIISREKNEFKRLRFLLIIVLIIVVITNFPTAVSRYHAAAVYIGIILLIFNKKISFDILFLIGIVIIFPTLDLFRRSTFGDVFSDMTFQFIELSSGHFDAYSMLMRTIEVVIIEGPSNGYQLLGALLFFIPRSLWITKPVGSGAYVGESLGLEFLNISSPLIAEVLINFGFVFFIIGPFLLGILNKKIDTRYWNYNEPLRFISIYFLFFIGFFFFILRGDLLSSFAYTIGFYIPLLIFNLIYKFKIN